MDNPTDFPGHTVRTFLNSTQAHSWIRSEPYAVAIVDGKPAFRSNGSGYWNLGTDIGSFHEFRPSVLRWLRAKRRREAAP